MNNRLGGILILIGVFVFGFIYIFFFFLPDRAEEKRLEQEKALAQVKEISLEKVELQEEESVEVEQTAKEKMQELIERNKYFKIIELDGKKFYFSMLNNELHLSLNDKVVGVFSLAPENTLIIDNIYNSRDYYIQIGNEKYVYNNTSGELYDLDLKVDVNYVKQSNNNYLLNTDKGTFVYSKTNRTLEYFVYFEDYVDYKEGYVGIISRDDTRRQKNLAIELKSDYAIYFYNPVSKENYIIYETNISLNRIYIDDDEIIFEDSYRQIYKLKNYM